MTNLKIKDLSLWDENPRFPEEYFKKSEKELVEYLFKKEEKKMLDLANSIVDNVNLKPLEKLVVLKSENKHIVLEGNRRLCIYKLLSNPSLISDNKLNSFFKEKAKKISISDNFEVECIVVSDKEEGLKYVELKHLEKGYSNWQESERINFRKRRGITSGEQEIIKHTLGDIVKKLDLPRELIDKVLGAGNLTTFYRIMASTPAREYFNYKIEDDALIINDEEFTSKLKVIIWQIVNKKDSKNNPINSRSMNSVQDIANYLNNLNFKKDLINTNKDISNSLKDKIDVFGNKTKEFILPGTGETTSKRKSAIVSVNDKIFGKILYLKRGNVNNLYVAIDRIYEQNRNSDAKLEVILPILGLSLRLLLDVAAREYYSEEQLKGNNTPYKTFLKEVKQKLRQEQKYKDLSTLTLQWVVSEEDICKVLDHYAHGSMVYTKNDILKISYIIGEILECFFKK